MKEYRNGVILRYRVSFHRVHNLTSSVLWVNASSLSATLTGLDPGHGYIISVEACNSAGRSPAAIVSITNKEDCESVFVILSVLHSTLNIIHVF